MRVGVEAIVRCRIWREGVVGPVFFKDSIKDKSYRMVQRGFYREFEGLHTEEEIGIFMQDGAVPHCRRTEHRQWLYSINSSGTPERLKIFDSVATLLARSYHLRLLRGGFREDGIQSRCIANVTKLRERIEAALQDMTDDTHKAAFKCYVKRFPQVNRRPRWKGQEQNLSSSLQTCWPCAENTTSYWLGFFSEPATRTSKATQTVWLNLPYLGLK